MNYWLATLTTLFLTSQCEAVSYFVPQSFLKSNSSSQKNTKHNVCAAHIKKIEAQHGIPNNLLAAIAKVESGKKIDTGEFVPWPWTANVGGKGYYFKSKAEAINKVRRLQAAGHKSIDVGCMQINLKHHPKAFASLEAAFDPAQNVAYGAKFLSNLKKQHGSWKKAVPHYHSSVAIHQLKYTNRVNRMLARENGGSKTKLEKLDQRKSQTVRVIRSKNGSVILASADKRGVRKVTRPSSRHFRKPLSTSKASTAVRRIVSRG